MEREHLQKVDVSWGVNRRRTGARTAMSASFLDLIRADMAVRAPLHGSREASFRFCARIGTMNGGARIRRALIPIHWRSGVDGGSPHPGHVEPPPTWTQPRE